MPENTHLTCLVHVKAVVPAAQLDADDDAIAGVYVFQIPQPADPAADLANHVAQGHLDPDASPEDVLREIALDYFHDHVGIAVLDDFDIACSVLPAGACPCASDLEDAVEI